MDSVKLILSARFSGENEPSQYLKADQVMYLEEVSNPAEPGEILQLIDNAADKYPYLFFCLSYTFGRNLLNVQPHRIPSPDPVCVLVGFKSIKPYVHSNISHFNILSSPQSPVADEAMIKAIQRAIQDMKNGEYYVINISRPYFFTYQGEPESAFILLSRLHPAPYSFLLQTRGYAILSVSPELFLKKCGNKLISAPMKGTRPAIPPSDAEFTPLNQDLKEKSENLMILDLMRSDLGKIAEIGSVKVEKMWHVKKYESVFQMISIISARIPTSTGLSEIISATYPPGSVTGAPKKRVVEAIADLEPYERGIYCGTAWLKTPQNNFTSSVLIRTFLFQKDGRARYNSGAGITVESNPETEVLELRWKMAPISVLMGGREKIWDAL